MVKWIKIKENELALICKYAREHLQSKIIDTSKFDMINLAHAIKIQERKMKIQRG